MINSMLLATAVLAATTGVAADSTYVKQIQDWRHERVEHLRAPHGWLSLVGLDWLRDGKNTLGSASGNDIVLAKAPAHLGTITLTGGKATIALDAKSGATIDGKSIREAELLDDSHDKPTTIAFGTVSFYLVQRGDKYGLRVKDSEAPTRTHFLGIDYFPIDASWRVEAKWEAYDPPHEVEEPNILGQVDKVVVPGAAVFERDGKTYRLEPVIETPGDTNLFLVFADKTSGHETYGAARFVYTEPPKDGKVVIDFNKAYNPPCAFTPYATCPLPTAQNRMKMRVTAGEKKYRGTHE
ncbi:MAG: DUF1684 domain-containing protein [Xanthomonadales bacterium PRO7]|jgi:uncharacterized protein (DUF1684 family)|nr:DUF1684 domain-containing protein [Xanthomonadales bacterium PRO7]HMM56770.1 DUF1684 domain-containing protein [Rudaea sp.]